MKYLKHYYVDATNTSSFLIFNNNAANGKTHPPISGLDVKIWIGEPVSSVDYCLSVCPDETHVPSISGIQELTFSQWADEAESQFNAIKGESALVCDKTNLDSIMNSYNQLSEEQRPQDFPMA